MSTRWKVRVVLVAFLVDAGGSALVMAAATPPASPVVVASPAATTRWSTKHLFKVGYTSSPAPVPLLAVHSWTVTILDEAGRPVDGATIAVLGGMPAHAHGLPTTPQVKSLGGGRYLIEGLKFHMPGAWAVGLRIKAGTVIDAVTFDLQLD